MCHVFDSTLRLYVQTAYGRDGGWLLQVEAVAVLPSVCLSVTDAGGRTAGGWLINAGPLQFRAAADG